MYMSLLYDGCQLTKSKRVNRAPQTRNDSVDWCDFGLLALLQQLDQPDRVWDELNHQSYYESPLAGSSVRVSSIYPARTC